MAISEASRKDLYTGLAGAIGPANAEVLMSVLPFYELDEIATKSDIALLKADIALLDARISRLEAEMIELRHDLHEMRKTMYRLSYTTLVTVVGAMATLQLIG
jgi:hypothetical protein